MVIPADLDPAKIQAALRSGLIGRPLQVLGEVGSTNDVVMSAGRAGAPEGLAVLADRQTAGRGRRGRSWASPAGVGLYTSILLRPGRPPGRVSLLTLVAGLAVAEAIQEVAGLDPRLKWPNDILVGGRKLAGILCELTSTDASVSYVALGIGINVNHGSRDLPEELSSEATTLSLATGRTIPRGDLASALYNALDRWYAAFCEGRTEAILALARQRSATLGRPVAVQGEDGQWRGLAVDLDDDGALLVQEDGGSLRRVVASEVSIRST